MNRIQKALFKINALLPDVREKLDALKHPKAIPDMKEKAEASVNGQQMMEQIIRNRFSRHESKGRAWSSDSKATEAKKRKKGESPEPLEATGALKQAAIKAVAGTFKVDEKIQWDINRIGLRYAKPANKKRHFFDPPSPDELKPAADAVSKVFRQEISTLTS